MRTNPWISVAMLGAALMLGGPATSQARPFFGGQVPGPPGGAGIVNLPYLAQDAQGNQWRIYQNGMLQQQQVNIQLYSQGAQLTINGMQPQSSTNQAQLDEKTGELRIENMQANGFTVTRHILINREDCYARYIDVIRNTGGQDQTVNLQIQTNFNYGISAAQMVADPRKKDQSIGWVGQIPVNNNQTSVVEVFAGKNSKNPMSILWPQGNSYVQASLSALVPAGKEIAVMHLHATAVSSDAGAAFVTGLKEPALLKTIPTALRKIIINFASTSSFVGDVEVLRGDVLDVVELRGGDQLKGTLEDKSFQIETFYGPVEVAADRVVGLINAGQFRPRQLVVTSDGQIFGGTMKKSALDLKLSSGQVIQVPLSQVARAGYRKRTGEPEEWTFEKPMVLMRTGERVGVQMPAAPIDVMTRYGKLQLKPDSVAAVLLQGEVSGVHEIHLADGSRFAGLLEADTFEMKLDDAGGGQTVKFPASGISRMQFAVKVAEADDATPTVQLANDDLLVGRLTGTLQIDTAFDTITVKTEELKTLTRGDEDAMDVQATLWDGSTLSGQLHEPELQCQLSGGLLLKVPVALLQQYQQPLPQPSGQMLEQIRAGVKDLNADDWKARDRAEQQLRAIGPVASGVLRELREGQPPEAQQRIDAILKELDKQRKGSKAVVAPAVPVQPPGPEE